MGNGTSQEADGQSSTDLYVSKSTVYAVPEGSPQQPHLSVRYRPDASDPGREPGTAYRPQGSGGGANTTRPSTDGANDAISARRRRPTQPRADAPPAAGSTTKQMSMRRQSQNHAQLSPPPAQRNPAFSPRGSQMPYASPHVPPLATLPPTRQPPTKAVAQEPRGRLPSQQQFQHPQPFAHRSPEPLKPVQLSPVPDISPTPTTDSTNTTPQPTRHVNSRPASRQAKPATHTVQPPAPPPQVTTAAAAAAPPFPTAPRSQHPLATDHPIDATLPENLDLSVSEYSSADASSAGCPSLSGHLYDLGAFLLTRDPLSTDRRASENRAAAVAAAVPTPTTHLPPLRGSAGKAAANAAHKIDVPGASGRQRIAVNNSNTPTPDHRPESTELRSEHRASVSLDYNDRSLDGMSEIAYGSIAGMDETPHRVAKVPTPPVNTQRNAVPKVSEPHEAATRRATQPTTSAAETAAASGMSAMQPRRATQASPGKTHKPLPSQQQHTKPKRVQPLLQSVDERRPTSPGRPQSRRGSTSASADEPGSVPRGSSRRSSAETGPRDHTAVQPLSAVMVAAPPPLTRLSSVAVLSAEETCVAVASAPSSARASNSGRSSGAGDLSHPKGSSATLPERVLDRPALTARDERPSTSKSVRRSSHDASPSTRLGTKPPTVQPVVHTAAPAEDDSASSGSMVLPDDTMNEALAWGQNEMGNWRGLDALPPLVSHVEPPPPRVPSADSSSSRYSKLDTDADSNHSSYSNFSTAENDDEVQMIDALQEIAAPPKPVESPQYPGTPQEEEDSSDGMPQRQMSVRRLRRRVSFADEKRLPLEKHL